ncbi:MAG: hypothetical protein P1U46_01610 [Patescibacteria group bacterium]|nr:hypothetical protein [Patescibacteria group bacterium]
MDEYSDEYDELYIENVGDDIYLFLDNDAIKFHNFRSLTKLQEESIISKNIDSRRIDKTAEIYNLIITNYVPKNKLEFEKLTSEIDFSDLFSNDSKCDYFYVYRY